MQLLLGSCRLRMVRVLTVRWVAVSRTGVSRHLLDGTQSGLDPVCRIGIVGREEHRGLEVQQRLR